MKTIGVIGAGKIGKTIATYLSSEGFTVKIADVEPKDIDGFVQLDASDKNALTQFVKSVDIIVSATLYHLNKGIADVCADTGVAYFDLTEDTEVSEHIRLMNTSTFMMPQSGLAPGAVNIIASDLIRKFDTVDKVKMRVGALPKYPTNAMAYYLTWSTDGLINEYVNDCDVLSNHKHIKTQPLDGLEQVYIDGDRYEAFNTSGGSASMCDTFADKVKSLSYKTIRYPGHQASMKFLLDDLNLKHNKKKFVDLFDQEVPYTTADVVVMLVSVIGKKDGQLLEKTWSKKIYGEDGHSAIQRTTASGVCSVVTAYARGELTGEGFVSQESVDYKVFTNNKFGQVYS
jgi:saccharopine dehydrogenase-like NADP-dependent oxidoreductase|tara:strand:- start:1314 stop:2342 length:1029 start_codon:yes stop_codon:yes gene_type:complete